MLDLSDYSVRIALQHDNTKGILLGKSLGTTVFCEESGDIPVQLYERGVIKIKRVADTNTMYSVVFFNQHSPLAGRTLVINTWLATGDSAIKSSNGALPREGGNDTQESKEAPA